MYVVVLAHCLRRSGDAGFRPSRIQYRYRSGSTACACCSASCATSWLHLGAGILGVGRRQPCLGGRALDRSASRILLGARALGRPLGGERPSLAFRARALGARARPRGTRTRAGAQIIRACEWRDRPRPFDLADLKRRGDRAPFDKLRAKGLFKTVSYLSFTPLSAKYFAAPGWNGIGEAAAFWFSSLKFSASLCTAIRSSRLSKMVLTML